MPASTPAAAPADPDRIRSEKTPAFRVLAALILPFMYAISRYEFHHPEKLPRQGAFVLAPNHFSNIDPIVVGIGMWKLGRAPRYFAKASCSGCPCSATSCGAPARSPCSAAGRVARAVTRSRRAG